MGLKHEAKALVSAAGVPVVPGYMGDEQSAARLAPEAERVGFPLLVKAVAGGGGKGMRVVREAGSARRSDSRSTQRGRECVRRRTADARALPRSGRAMSRSRSSAMPTAHCVHLFERECSVQRRYQKIIEESPSPFIDAATRAAMTDGRRARGKGRRLRERGHDRIHRRTPTATYYFMEMNTRLQVEHPVTEMVTGLDLVEWQLRVASGERLPLAQAADPPARPCNRGAHLQRGSATGLPALRRPRAALRASAAG